LTSRIPDSIRKKHEKEFERLRHGSKADLVRPFLFAIIFIAAVFVCVSALQNYTIRSENIQSARVALISEGAVWGEEFLHSQRSYRDWLISYGTAKEVELFEKVSQILFGNAASFGIDGGTGILSRTYLAAHFGVMRVGFFLIASWRLWLLAILIALLRAALSSEVHLESDILGQAGNGRLFYSGIKADLNKTSPGGAPESQVAGLACPAQVSKSVVMQSELAKILRANSALNETNIGLAGVVLAHKKWPAYVAVQEEESLLANFIEVPPLIQNAEVLLEELFSLHKKYKEIYAENDSLEENLETEVAPEIPEDEKLGKEEFRSFLRANMDRSLTSSMKERISEIGPDELATTVLAVEAGKALAFGFEGGRWARRSNFPQLSARAVLHSLPAFASEYNFDRRTLIRRAIIYAARSSHFGPIRMPVNLSSKSRALRQWVELLMASPHELQSSADDVQLFGLLGDAHKAWIDNFFDGIITLNPDIVANIYVNQGNLLFIPLEVLLKLVQDSVSKSTLSKLAELVPRVSQKQRLDALSQNFGGESGEEHESAKVPAFQKVFPPFSHTEVKDLAKEHGVSEDAIRRWSYIRVILNNYGWLGRRVGDYSVPENSLIYAILKFDSHPEANDLGLVSRPAMVALRASKLKEKWGPSWHSRFVNVRSVSMAETEEEARRVLKGQDPKDENSDTVESAWG